MPNGISKRQQLRNEKALAELIRTVPGNDRCADCEALTPGWASWNMGIFLCMRCAAIHRKLGTHISKVKSLSMDTWSSEQVDNMKSHGNLLMNKIYNPKNIKPPVPTDIDESDSCMERYIRQKYQYRSLEDGKPKPPSRDDASYSRTVSSRRDGSPINSPESSPPPLPPKSSKLFGFGLRGSSSTSNLRRFGNKKASPGPDQRSWSPPPPLPARKSSGLGAPVADVKTASLESKMAALREMGFTNDRRNEMVLRGLNEDLDRSIETLVRLGEGSNASSRTKTPAPTTTVNNAMDTHPVASTSQTSTNPFERAASNPVPQQSASYNPFDRPSQTTVSAQPLEASFQNLQVSQPLFPHSTGGYPSQANPIQQPLYQQPYTPPVTSAYSQGPYVSSPQAIDNNYNPFFQTSPQPQSGIASQPYANANGTQNIPFFNNAPQNTSFPPQPQQTVPSVSNISVPRQPQHANTMPAMSSASPFGTSPFAPTPSFRAQPQPQPQLQPQNVLQASYNPFQQSLSPAASQTAGVHQNQYQPQQPQQLMPQPTSRMDKGSILSLYNLSPSPSTASSIPEQTQFQPGAATSPVPPLTNSLQSTPQTQPGSSIPTPQQPNGAGQPSTASRNPFGAASVGSGLAAQAGVTPHPPSSGLGIGIGSNVALAPAHAPAAGAGMGIKTSSAPFNGLPAANSTFPRAHMSQPSMDINGLQNGRHSPDAFASLSARYG